MTTLELKSDILERMAKGDYLIHGIGGWFWANPNHRGGLIEGASQAELDVVMELYREGSHKVVKGQRRIIYSSDYESKP